MAKTNADIQEIFDALLRQFERENHSLASHDWRRNAANDEFRHISFFPKREETKTLRNLHFELIKRGGYVWVEIHPEGNLEFKQLVEKVFDTIELPDGFEFGAHKYPVKGDYSGQLRKIVPDQFHKVHAVSPLENVLIPELAEHFNWLYEAFYHDLGNGVKELLYGNTQAYSESVDYPAMGRELQGFDNIYESVKSHFKSKPLRLGRAAWRRGRYDMHAFVSFFDMNHVMFKQTSLVYQFGINGDQFFVRIGCLKDDPGYEFFKNLLPRLKLPIEYHVLDRPTPGFKEQLTIIEFSDSIHRYRNTPDSDVVVLLIKTLSNTDSLLYHDIKEAFVNEFARDNTEKTEINRQVGIDVPLSEAEIASSDLATNNQKKNYWWINAHIDRWNIDEFKVGDSETYGTRSKDGIRTKIFDHFFKVRKGDLAIGYQSGQDRETKAVFQIIREAESDGDYIEFRLIYKFAKPERFQFSELKNSNFFTNSEVIRNNNQGSLFSLSEAEFLGVCSKSGFDLRDGDNGGIEGGNDDAGAGDGAASRRGLAIEPTRSVRSDNDSAHGDVDYLDFDADVKVLASLIALKDFEPPLAIALFGNWGKGKSFNDYPQSYPKAN